MGLFRPRSSGLAAAVRRSLGAFAEQRGISRVSLPWAHRARRLTAADTAYAGLILTAAIVVLTYFGALETPETWSYDLRTKYAQWGRPAPTDKLVHLDLNDRAIADIGRWPWSRAVQAELLDEIGMARPKAVALDILYSEPEKDTIVEGPDGKYVRIENDKLFEEAVRRLGNVIVAYSHEDATSVRQDASFRAMVAELRKRPEMSEDELVSLMKGMPEAGVRLDFLGARETAIAQLVHEKMSREGMTNAEVATALIGERKSDGILMAGPVTRTIDAAWERELSRQALLPHRFSARKEVTSRLDNREPNLLPMVNFARAASDTAFVTYNKEGDGKMRRMPMVMDLGGEPSPSLGLALACRQLDVPLSSLTLKEDGLAIPYGGRSIKVPLRTVQFDKFTRPTGGSFDLPWFGGGGDSWQTMYDRPGDPHTVSMSEVYQVVDTRRRIVRNNEELRAACITMGMTDVGLEKRSYAPEDAGAWVAVGREQLDALGDVGSQPLPPEPSASAGADEWKGYRALRAARPAQQLIAQQELLGTQLTALRAGLAKKLGGRSVLIGWTATGRTDFIATPLHPACAGVRIHGVVFNAILTNQFITFSPLPMTLITTLIVGLLTTWAVIRLPLPPAFGAALALAGGYALISAVCFGPFLYVLGMAGPISAIAGTYIGCSLLKYLIESGERKRILRRFSNYVDPQLVNYVLKYPDKAGLDGEKRLMTVCFTDLAGFTTLSEKLGEQTVGLLNEYFAVMVPLIRKHHGYLNKFLGDGIMFFFNAPEPNPRHAAAAFDSVLEMQAALKVFNAALLARGLSPVKMRVGITTGEMIAGDAGGGGASDYTVLGDVVNLSSRLEGANKASGTLILCNREAQEHAGPGFLTRPVGTLKVVGKTLGIQTYEVMCAMVDATESMKTIAKLTEEMVAAFRAGDMVACGKKAHELKASGDPSKLSSLYLTLAEIPVTETFDGSITLDSK